MGHYLSEHEKTGRDLTMTNATETRAEYTPGPWIYGYHEVIENYIVGPDNGDGIRVVADVGPSRRADARLIAAAPELLEAAEEAARNLPEIPGCGDTRTVQEACDFLAGQLRSAIAKARGEPQVTVRGSE